MTLLHYRPAHRMDWTRAEKKKKNFIVVLHCHEQLLLLRVSNKPSKRSEKPDTSQSRRHLRAFDWQQRVRWLIHWVSEKTVKSYDQPCLCLSCKWFQDKGWRCFWCYYWHWLNSATSATETERFKWCLLYCWEHQQWQTTMCLQFHVVTAHFTLTHFNDQILIYYNLIKKGFLQCWILCDGVPMPQGVVPLASASMETLAFNNQGLNSVSQGFPLCSMWNS